MQVRSVGCHERSHSTDLRRALSPLLRLLRKDFPCRERGIDARNFTRKLKDASFQGSNADFPARWIVPKALPDTEKIHPQCRHFSAHEIGKGFKVVNLLCWDCKNFESLAVERELDAGQMIELADGEDS